MRLEETVYKVGLGVDTYNPDLADGGTLKFKRLKNLQPEQNRLRAPKGLSLLQTITGETTGIRGFGYYNVPQLQSTNLYAFSNTSVYPFSFNTQLFETTAIYSSFPDNENCYAKVPWLDALYVTKRFAPLVKIQDNVVSVVSGAPGGRYMVIADSHLMLANTYSAGVQYPVRMQWSDLYAPEAFTVGPSSEADFFELSPDDGEITGLSYQRGVTLAYTRDRIWAGRYQQSNDGTTPGRYRFDTLFSGVGNLYHDAQVRVKEVDFFIGSDNVYKLDGFQLSEVGDEIWSFFKSTLKESNFEDSVVAIHEPDRYSIMWVYNHVDGYKWSIVYNYKENKWSDRDPENVFTGTHLLFPVRGFLSYEELSGSYEAFDTTYGTASAPVANYDGDWQYLDSAIRVLYGSSVGKVLVPSSPESFTKHDDSAFSCELETFEFDFDELQKVKEISKLKLLYAIRSVSDDVNDNDLKLYVGTRENQTEAVSWSASVDMVNQLVGETIFHFRNKGVGKFIRFKLVWTNNEDFAITELYKLSFNKVENDSPTPEK